MNNSEKSPPLPLNKIPKWMVIGFLVISLLGFLDATYLTITHFSGGKLVCDTSGGCTAMTSNQYATIGPVPVALLGAIYYLLLFLLTVGYLDTKKEMILKMVAKITVIGFAMSLWFVFLQLVVLKQICWYCMVSATTSTLLFILGMIFLSRTKTQTTRPPT